MHSVLHHFILFKETAMSFFSRQSDDVSTQTVSRGLWFARHRQKILRFFHRFLLFLDIAFFVILLLITWNWISHISQTTQITQSFAVSSLLKENRDRPDPLLALEPVVVRRDSDAVDALVQIQNPNTFWAAYDASYELLFNGQIVKTDTVTIAPGDTYYATALRIPWTNEMPSMTMRVVDVQWKTLPKEQQLPSVDWKIENPSLQNSSLLESQSDRISQFSFSLTNASSYGYSEPEVVVIIQSDDAIIATAAVSLNRIESFETRNISFEWPEFSQTRSLTADVFVNVNRLDETGYFLSSKKIEISPTE